MLRPGARLIGSCFVEGDDSHRQRMLIRSNSHGFGNVGTDEAVMEWLDAAGFLPSSTTRSGPMLYFDCQVAISSG